jgi:TATA-box binding protein (TBP) (component of TFIID and TFIIIB)
MDDRDEDVTKEFYDSLFPEDSDDEEETSNLLEELLAGRQPAERSIEEERQAEEKIRQVQKLPFSYASNAVRPTKKQKVGKAAEIRQKRKEQHLLANNPPVEEGPNVIDRLLIDNGVFENEDELQEFLLQPVTITVDQAKIEELAKEYERISLQSDFSTLTITGIVGSICTNVELDLLELGLASLNCFYNRNRRSAHFSIRSRDGKSNLAIAIYEKRGNIVSLAGKTEEEMKLSLQKTIVILQMFGYNVSYQTPAVMNVVMTANIGHELLLESDYFTENSSELAGMNITYILKENGKFPAFKFFDNVEGIQASVFQTGTILYTLNRDYKQPGEVVVKGDTTQKYKYDGTEFTLKAFQTRIYRMHQKFFPYFLKNQFRK